MCTFHRAVIPQKRNRHRERRAGEQERKTNLFEIAHGNQAVMNMPGPITGLVIKEVEMQQHPHMLPGEKPVDSVQAGTETCVLSEFFWSQSPVSRRDNVTTPWILDTMPSPLATMSLPAEIEIGSACGLEPKHRVGSVR